MSGYVQVWRVMVVGGRGWCRGVVKCVEVWMVGEVAPYRVATGLPMNAVAVLATRAATRAETKRVMVMTCEAVCSGGVSGFLAAVR